MSSNSTAQPRRPDDLLAVTDAAAIAQRSVRTIRRAYSDGSLTAFRDGRGRSVRIAYEDLRAWMMSEEVHARPEDSLDPRELIRAARARNRR